MANGRLISSTEIVHPMCLNSVIIGFINNRFSEPVHLPTIYRFSGQETLKLLLIFIDLAMEKGFDRGRRYYLKIHLLQMVNTIQLVG